MLHSDIFNKHSGGSWVCIPFWTIRTPYAAVSSHSRFFCYRSNSLSLCIVVIPVLLLLFELLKPLYRPNPSSFATV